MIALVDTNVVLDVMLARERFLSHSAAVLAAAETSRCRAFLCGTAITTIHYIATRQIGAGESRARMADLMSIFEIAPVNRAVLISALDSEFADFEDAVVHEAAVQVGADCIVTRNVPDFRAAQILVYAPEQFIEALGAGGE